MPTAYFAADDTPQAICAAQGRRIILSTGRGDTRITIDEAYDLERTIRVAIMDQVEREGYERAAIAQGVG